MEKEKVLKIINSGFYLVPIIIAGFCIYVLYSIESNMILSDYESLVISGFSLIIVFLGYIASALIMKNDR